MIEDSSAAKTKYNYLLLIVAGLGGLLYGVDVGIIAGALPYLEATFRDVATGQLLNSNQVSLIVAAVLLGSVISTLFAGLLSDWLGRRTMMIISGLSFVVSIPMISLAHGYDSLMAGRLLQGVSGGFIGVVIPLYLAECLSASSRGKGTGVFQWLLTLGLVMAAGIGLYFSARVDAVARFNSPDKLFAFKDAAWRDIFWVSLPPGILFVIGSFMVTESPRWLFRHGKKEAASIALLRSRSEEQVKIEIKEMEETIFAGNVKIHTSDKTREGSIFRRKYVVPFLLACVILACNQTTGINSIIGYNTTILIQAGLDDKMAHACNFFFAFVNFLVTITTVILVDLKGRKFLLSFGTAGIIVSLVCLGTLSHRTEKMRIDVKNIVQSMVATNETLSLTFNETMVTNLLVQDHAEHSMFQRFANSTLVVIYSYGDFHGATTPARSVDLAGKPIEITRGSVLPANKVIAVLKNPLASFDGGVHAPLRINHALITPMPDRNNGWLTAMLLFVFVGFFASGPGVCVWLALSELMPTRIRSNGMSIALLINQTISTTIAAIFLPTVGAYGYATIFFAFAGCTVIYFATATFFLPETKGKTLEEIEEYFEGSKKIEEPNIASSNL